MRNMSRIICSILVCIMLVPIFLVGCVSGESLYTDTDTFAESEYNSDRPISDLLLIGPGAHSYTIIRPDILNEKEMSAMTLIVDHFKKSGVTPTISTDWKGNGVSDYEIVIGDTTRDNTDGGIDLDRIGLVEGEYLIKVSGYRIYIVGGTPDDTLTATKYFLTKFWGYDEGTGSIKANTEIVIPRDYEYVFQRSFNISSVMIGEKLLEEYRITWDSDVEKSYAKKAAEKLQDFFSMNVGYKVRIDEKNELDIPAIVLSGKTIGNSGVFSASIKDGDLVLCTDISDGFGLGINRFLGEYFSKDGEIKLENNLNYTTNLLSTVSYMDFGAKGDGRTDDLKAIIATHEYANKHNLPVKAGEGKKFYIGACDKGAVIKTSTDFTGADIIIDDRNVSMSQRKVAVFTVEPDKASYELTSLKKLSVGQTNIGMTLPEDSVIILTEAGTKRYIRKGYHADNDGVDQNEIIVVDKNGNISATTPVIWDYTNITSAVVTPIDKETLTIKGGRFTTIVSNYIEITGYYKRGFLINRSNVVVDGIKHYTENEGKDGAPYQSFMYILECANITFNDCLFTPHRTYFWMKNGTRTSVGTYDISPWRVANFKMKNCKQTIDILDQAYWGVMSSNFCKNILLDSCKLSRIDAHQGVHNATVLNSELGWLGVDIAGSGTLRIEGTTIHGISLIKFRDDYGNTWHGDVILKDCTWVPNRGQQLTDSYYSIIGGTNLQEHYFGYQCYMPTTITIENLTIDDTKAATSYKGIALFGDINPNLVSPEAEAALKQSYIVTEKVDIKGLTIKSGKSWIVSTNEYMFRNVKINIS